MNYYFHYEKVFESYSMTHQYRFISYGKFHQPGRLLKIVFFSRIKNLKSENRVETFLSLEVTNRQESIFKKLFQK